METSSNSNNTETEQTTTKVNESSDVPSLDRGFTESSSNVTSEGAGSINSSKESVTNSKDNITSCDNPVEPNSHSLPDSTTSATEATKQSPPTDVVSKAPSHDLSRDQQGAEGTMKSQESANVSTVGSSSVYLDATMPRVITRTKRKRMTMVCYNACTCNRYSCGILHVWTCAYHVWLNSSLN